MSEQKLEKIGGYVVNGQPQLAHNNSLKGTGLPDSPLGVSENGFEIVPSDTYKGVGVWHKDNKSYARLETNNEYSDETEIYSQNMLTNTRASITTNSIGNVDTNTWKYKGGHLTPDDVKVYDNDGNVTHSLVDIGNRTAETVLWEMTPEYSHGSGTWNPSFTLSETVANFEKVDLWLVRTINSERSFEIVTVQVIDGTVNYRVPAWPENGYSDHWFNGGITLNGTSGSQWGAYNSASKCQEKYLPNGWYPGSFYKVVGINRKST